MASCLKCKYKHPEYKLVHGLCYTCRMRLQAEDQNPDEEVNLAELQYQGVKGDDE